MNTQGKGLTTSEKVMLILEGIAKRAPVTKLCQEAQITPKQYYNLQKKAMIALEAAMQDAHPGRPQKDRAQDLTQAQQTIQGLKQDTKYKEKALKSLERQVLKLTQELAMAKRLIQYRIDDGRLPSDVLKKISLVE